MEEIISLNLILESLGTFAFAVSGVRLAAQKNFDLFGAYVVGVATAIGGGTIRDVMLDIPIFWLDNPIYLIICALALAYVILPEKLTMRQTKTILLFDTIGLALFTIVGTHKCEALGYPFWTSIIMGCITGAAGGVMRDVLASHVPLIFRKEIYALACVLGSAVYFICAHIGMNDITSSLAGGSTVFIMRYLAIRFRLSLPILREKK